MFEDKLQALGPVRLLTYCPKIAPDLSNARSRAGSARWVKLHINDFEGTVVASRAQEAHETEPRRETAKVAS